MSKVILKTVSKPLSFIGVPFSWATGNAFIHIFSLLFYRNVLVFMILLVVSHIYLAFKAYQDIYFYQVWLYRAERMLKPTTSFYQVKGRRYAAR